MRKRTISAGRKGAKPQHYADERAINVVMFAAEKKRYWAAKLALLNADRFPDYAHEGLVVPLTDYAKKYQEQKRWACRMVAAARIAGESAEAAKQLAASAAGVHPSTVKTWLSDLEAHADLCFTPPGTGLWRRKNLLDDEVRVLCESHSHNVASRTVGG